MQTICTLLQTDNHTNTSSLNFYNPDAVFLTPSQQCQSTEGKATANLAVYTHTHTYNGPLSGTTQVSRYQKGKTNQILLKQVTVSGSGISWAICKSATRSRQITMPAPHHSVFTGRMPFLPPNQQRQSTDGTLAVYLIIILSTYLRVSLILTEACLLMLDQSSEAE